MKIVIPGGTGFLGQMLAGAFLADTADKHDVVVLSRGGGRLSPARLEPWDGVTLGEWAKQIDGADVVINLAGKSVKCLYTDKTLKVLRDSRVLSTEAIGQAIKQAKNPPLLWIQMSTASVYAHSLNSPNDEKSGVIGEAPSTPYVWKQISKLAKDWEQAASSKELPHTRQVIARLGVVMGLHKGHAFDMFVKLCHFGLGGKIADGKQMVTWIHEKDFIRAIKFLIQNKNIKGPVNLCSPEPLPQGEFMKTLREVVGARFGLPATKWMVELSSYFTRIDSELVLKSRYAVPKVLEEQGFKFQFPTWRAGAKDLYSSWKK